MKVCAKQMDPTFPSDYSPTKVHVTRPFFFFFVALKIIFPGSGLIYTQTLFSPLNPFSLKLYRISEHTLLDPVHLQGLQEHFLKAPWWRQEEGFCVNNSASLELWRNVISLSCQGQLQGTSGYFALRGFKVNRIVTSEKHGWTYKQ